VHLYVMRCGRSALKINRNQFVDLCAARGVGTSVHCIPLNTMDFTSSGTGYKTGDFRSPKRFTAAASRYQFFPAMSSEDISYVIETVRAVARESRRLAPESKFTNNNPARFIPTL